MAQSAPHSRAWLPGRFPVGLATFALALILALAIAYVAVLGDPFAHTAPAFSYSGNPSTVDVMRNGVSTAVPVQTGITDGTSTQIVSGLQPGDVVVTDSTDIANGSTQTSTARTGTILGSGGGTRFLAR
jgi:hypothetical protein